jgi:hypothetical protein
MATRKTPGLLEEHMPSDTGLQTKRSESYTDTLTLGDHFRACRHKHADTQIHRLTQRHLLDVQADTHRTSE